MSQRRRHWRRPDGRLRNGKANTARRTADFCDEVRITNGAKSGFRQTASFHGGTLGDYEVTVTPVSSYTGPFTVTIDEGAAYGCSDGTDVSSCDLTNLAFGDTLSLYVEAADAK